MAAESDEQQMLRVKAGDADALTPLVERYRTPLVHFLYRMVHDAATAEELAQEVFLRVYRARSSYKPRAKFSTWLFKIATNVALNSLRDGRLRRTREVPAGSNATRNPKWNEAAAEERERLADVADARPTMEQYLMERERLAVIRRAVEELPEKQRLAVLLHKYQEIDYKEIAEILECSESALKSLLFRAYEALRVRLKPFVGNQEA